MFPKHAWYFILVLVIHCPKCALHFHFCKKSTITPNFLHYIIEHLWYCNPNHPWVFSACVKALGGLYPVYLWNRESSRITPNLPSSNSLYTQIFLVATFFFPKILMRSPEFEHCREIFLRSLLWCLISALFWTKLRATTKRLHQKGTTFANWTYGMNIVALLEVYPKSNG